MKIQLLEYTSNSINIEQQSYYPSRLKIPINLHQMYKPAVLAVEPHKRDDRGTIERER